VQAGKPTPQAAVPVLAVTFAVAYLGAWLWWPLLAGMVAVAPVGACALVLVRRPSLRLNVVLVAIAAWLAVGIGGACLLRMRPVGGLAWVLLVLYALPLPLIPWLYARTFPSASGGRPGQTP
jgi:hypothetical protein